MLLVAFFVAGIVLSGGLAYSGLVKGRLPVSKTANLTGRAAKVVGSVCLAFCVALLGAIALSIIYMAK
jgi:hypothetical protein